MKNRLIFIFAIILSFTSLSLGNGTAPTQNMIAYISVNSDHNFDIALVGIDGENRKKLTNNGQYKDFLAWSPDRSRILFTTFPNGEGRRKGKRELRVISLTDDSQILLAENIDWASVPSWSHDGKRVLFTVKDKSRETVCSVQADGMNYFQISNSTSNGTSPSWSLDDAKIVYESYSGFNRNIVSVGQDGLNEVLLAQSGETLLCSPMDSRIAFYQRSLLMGGKICIIDPNSIGGKSMAVDSIGNQDIKYLTWSPDGRNIAAILSETTDDGKKPKYQLIAYSLFPKPKEIKLSHWQGGMDTKIFWSPDSKKLVHPLFKTLVIYDIDHKSKKEIAFDKKLFNTAIISSDASWSLDSSQIVFSGFKSYQDKINLYCVDQDGNGLKQLTTDGGAVPAWTPDSSYMINDISGIVFTLGS